MASTAAAAATATSRGTGHCIGSPTASSAAQPARVTNENVSIALREWRSASSPA